MHYPEISLLVPHAEPMLLLDHIISIDKDMIYTAVTIRTDSLFCETVGVGSWIGIEYMAQTMAAYAGYTARQKGEPVKIGFLLGSRRYECKKPYFLLGSTLIISARSILESDNGMSAFECTISESSESPENNTIIATAVINAFLPENI